MITKRGGTIGRQAVGVYHHPFGPVFFILQQTYIHHIAGHCILNKDHFPVRSGQAFPLGGIVQNQQLFEYDIFLFISHGAKITGSGQPPYSEGVFLQNFPPAGGQPFSPKICLP